ncbi:hypothetical protein NC651_004566 [Populus alba x Populus x berolinensis]|nr:hypothetical protein NC651_004566 [Populus alba x Populus x berolinensis]
MGLQQALVMDLTILNEDLVYLDLFTSFEEAKSARQVMMATDGEL